MKNNPYVPSLKVMKEHDKIEKEYLKSSGTQCPFCKSEKIKQCNIKNLDDIFCGELACHKTKCLTCKRTWEDVYVLRGINYYDHESNTDVLSNNC